MSLGREDALSDKHMDFPGLAVPGLAHPDSGHGDKAQRTVVYPLSANPYLERKRDYTSRWREPFVDALFSWCIEYRALHVLFALEREERYADDVSASFEGCGECVVVVRCVNREMLLAKVYT